METILYPLEWFVAAIMVGWYKLFTLVGMPAASGWTWALSIAGLVIVLRILLIPLFVKQIHASRRMQLIQPEMQKIQKKYKGKKDPESRQKQQEEMMELYRTTGTNPLGSCLPIILQAPFFFALFRVLNNLSKIADGRHDPIGFLTQKLAQQAESSTVLGAKLSSTFMKTSDWSAAPKWVALLLIIGMSASSFITQHQLMRRNMPPAALEGPMAKQQQIIIYVMPLFFLISGINFPIGVLLYWLTTNVWTLGQQWYVIRRMPTPGSAAERKLEERNRARGREHKKMTMDDLKAEGEKKGKSRFMQAMEKAQEQQKAQQAAKSGKPIPASKTQSKAKAGSVKLDKKASQPAETTSVDDAEVESPAASPVNERPVKTGPRNQPKRNVSRAKRKKK